jgi:hypothetical protein
MKQVILMSVMFDFDHASSSKKIEFYLCHANEIEERIEGFLVKQQMDTTNMDRYISEVESMLYEICHDPDCEYSSVVMYIL